MFTSDHLIHDPEASLQVSLLIHSYLPVKYKSASAHYIRSFSFISNLA